MWWNSIVFSWTQFHEQCLGRKPRWKRMMGFWRRAWQYSWYHSATTHLPVGGKRWSQFCIQIWHALYCKFTYSLCIVYFQMCRRGTPPFPYLEGNNQRTCDRELVVRMKKNIEWECTVVSRSSKKRYVVAMVALSEEVFVSVMTVGIWKKARRLGELDFALQQIVCRMWYLNVTEIRRWVQPIYAWWLSSFVTKQRMIRRNECHNLSENQKKTWNRRSMKWRIRFSALRLL